MGWQTAHLVEAGFSKVFMIGTDLRISVPLRTTDLHLADLFRQILSHWTLSIISLMAAGGVSLLSNLVSHVTAVHCVNEHLFFPLLLHGLCNNGVLEDSFFFAFYGSEAFPLLLTLRFGSVLFSRASLNLFRASSASTSAADFRRRPRSFIPPSWPKNPQSHDQD